MAEKSPEDNSERFTDHPLKQLRKLAGWIILRLF